METPVPKKPKSSLSKAKETSPFSLVNLVKHFKEKSSLSQTPPPFPSQGTSRDVREVQEVERISFPWIAELSAISVRLMLTWACQRGVIGR
ncbi:hypothetical protein SCA6_007664 [Theobroma cacao]